MCSLFSFLSFCFAKFLRLFWVGKGDGWGDETMSGTEAGTEAETVDGGFSAATESSTEVRANCVARDREPIQKSPSNQSQSQSESQAKPGISLFCLALIAGRLGQLMTFYIAKETMRRDATQQRRRVKPKLKLRVQVKRKPQKIRSWLTYLNLFQTCYI